MIYLYTDGSVTKPSEGKSPGGWAFCYRHNGKQYRGSGGCKDVTSNQMEMVAVIKGLQHLLANKFQDVTIIVVSDSQYVINGSSQWLPTWKRNRWVNSKKKAIKNKEFWKQIDYLASNFQTRWKWIRGHMGNPDNEYCDQAARTAAFRLAHVLEMISQPDP